MISHDLNQKISLFNQAWIVHPDKIPREDPRENKHIDSAEYYASSADPRKSRQCLKYCVVKFYAAHATDRKKSAEKADKINYLRAERAFPSVFF